MSIFNCPVYNRRRLGEVVQPPNNAGDLKSLATFSAELGPVESTRVLPAGKRRYLNLKNLDSVNTIYVAFGAAAIIGSPVNIRLLANDEKSFNVFIPEDDLNAIADGGAPKLQVSVGVA